MIRLQRDQAAVVTLYSGVVVGPIEDAAALASVLLSRPVATSELADEDVVARCRTMLRETYLALGPTLADPPPLWMPAALPIAEPEPGEVGSGG